MPRDAQMQAVVDGMAEAGANALSSMSPQQARAVSEEGFAHFSGEPVADVEDREIPGPAGALSIRIYRPTLERPAPAVVYFHGGGWTICNINTHDAPCRAMANASGAVFISVEYRLAPESKFPAAVDDCLAATRCVAGHAGELGVDPSRLGVGGDSAGGNLAAVVALLARDEGGPALAHQLLIYPATDFTVAPAMVDDGAAVVLSSDDMAWFNGNYLAGSDDAKSPTASPTLAASHRDLPPALVLTAEYDPLCPQGEKYAEVLQAAGVPVTSLRYDGLDHGFLHMSPVVDRAAQAVRDIGAHLRTTLVP